MKETIATAGNTVVPAFLALKAKGYRVSRSTSAGSDEFWIAESDERKFVAEDVLLLLGLVGMYENRGPNWKASGAEIEAFLKEFP